MFKTLGIIFLTFMKIGVCTFGGGYAMIPILQREIVKGRKWVTDEEIMDYYVIGQCTPGVIAVNVATFVGQKVFGIIGGIVATLGLIFPSYLIICMISLFLQKFSEISYIQSAFAGIRIAVCALVVHTVAGMIRKNVKNALTFFVLAATFILVAFFNISPVIIVPAVAIIGLIFNDGGNER